jgi:hypothetical protein
VPHAVAFLSTLLVAWHSDRVSEKTAHVGVPYVLGAVVLATFGAATRRSGVGGFVVLTLSMGLLWGGQSTMCARVVGLAPPAQAGMTLALFNAVCASLGGGAGPIAVGAILKGLGSFELAAIVLGLCAGVAGCIMLCIFAWERGWFAKCCGGRRGWTADASASAAATVPVVKT